MAEPASSLPLVEEFPLAWTTADLERWLAKLPAQERAEIAWTAPGLKAALDPLLTESLEEPVIDAATQSYLRVVSGCRRFMLRILADDVPLAPLYKPWLERIPSLQAFLVSPISGAHAEKSLRAVVGFSLKNWEELRQLYRENKAEIERRLSDLDLEPLNEGPGRDISRATLLVSALLEAMDRGVPAARGRELARLALRHALRAVDGLRRLGATCDEIATNELSKEEREDRYLDAAAELVLAGRYDVMSEFGVHPSPITLADLEALQALPMLPAAPPPAPRIRRSVANIACVAFRPAPAISFEGDFVWYPATEKLVERAVLLREQPVLATIVTGAQPRLLRIDPADKPPTSDESVRTRDMLQDWDELLERLAK